MSIRKQAMRFWNTFMIEQSNLEKALLANHVEEIAEIKKILATYFEELCNCELEIEVEDGIFELTFLPEQEKNAQIICSLLKHLTPEKVSKKWVVHSSLPPLSQKALHTVLRLKERDYTANDFLVYYEIDTQSRYVDVEIYCDAFSQIDPNKALEVGIYMLQLAIGEVALEAYINTINVIEQKRDSETCCSLSSFYEHVMDLVDEHEWAHYEDATMIYRAFHLKEDAIQELVRKDMKLITTIHPLLMSEYFHDEYFIHHQFFDFGGEYGYVYYEHNQEAAKDAYVRQMLEKQLHDLLYKNGIARTIGGAMGTVYAYIDLAIFDKEAFLKAIDKINDKLQINVTYRSFEE